MNLKDRANEVFRILQKRHADAVIELRFGNPLELLIATILSAQCTDVRVNQVTAVLFKKCRSAKDYLNLSQPALEEIIRSTGFFRQKAKSIKGAVKAIVEDYNGEVPSTLEELITLPGVGRKTANVVLGNAFDTPGMPVDTHVMRVSRRLDLTKHEDPVRIETDLTKLIAPKFWTNFSHTLIFHGRRICKARKPLCIECPVNHLCRFPKISSKL